MRVWRFEHPKLNTALYAASTAFGLWFLARGFVALASGVPMSSRLVVYLLVFGAMTVGNALGLRTAVRILTDAEAERARAEQRWARMMGQPRRVLLRKAAAMIAVLTAVVVATGVLTLVIGHGTGAHVFGVVFLVLGLVVGASGVWRLRHPPF